MLGRGNGIAAGRVQHDDAASRRRFDIDIVHANTGATDHAQTRSGSFRTWPWSLLFRSEQQAR